MTLRDVTNATPRYRLAELPTPLERLDRLSAHLGGPTLWAKRDDLTGLGLGGNKVRKLEYVIPDALAHDADVLVTAGVAQSNSVRQIAAAAARAGIACCVVQFTQRTDDPGERELPTGNALIIRLLGAEIVPRRWTGDRVEAVEAVAAELTGRGRRPYIVPYGVSNPLGALGYIAAAEELLAQFQAAAIRPTAVVHASGSGGTQGGLVVGFAGSEIHVIGVDVDAEPDRVRSDVSSIAVQLANDFELDARSIDASIEVIGGYAGPAYGATTTGMIEALDLGARLEALILDPVYSAKALAAIIGMIRRGRFSPDDDIVFIHTGGAPSLLARPELLAPIEMQRR
jgi:D-cysteine desulfhydrase family pyridoxal phosphate-dependent enzyme